MDAISHYTWLLPAICCGLLAVYCNVLLGRQVLIRGIIFIDLAMAQVAALGILLTDKFFHVYMHQYAWASYLGATLLTGLVAFVIAKLESRRIKHLEAIIGAFYVLSACLAIILVSNNPHGIVLVKSLLQGQLLWVNWSQAWVLLGFSVLLFTVNHYHPQFLKGSGFYVAFALAIPMLIQTLGVYLEFAMLVVPAVAAASLMAHRPIIVAFIIASIGLMAGLMSSLFWDIPSGPAIVLMICLTALFALLVVRLFKMRVKQGEKPIKT
ncbi:metal ABC transporter permease [Psychromonas sp. Urea-02u-13]|uniref:metal ABC transporter permease n=1 Tax=Psychromonas sp. Urea-02u-13 TaxID=2058326 RepID=UPI000C347B1C|nr:metal ABC transporter permease [Psychromonas sp. Urea-02u-13]PKG37185.1 ABC transporter [Psychromonas sp. Urea-02u-13]